MRRRKRAASWVLGAMIGVSLLIVSATIALWIQSERNLGVGRPITVIGEWGDGASVPRRTVLLGLGQLSYHSSRGEGPLPPGTVQGRTVYDLNWEGWGFAIYRCVYRPLDANGGPLPGVYGRGHGFAVPLGGVLLLGLVLPLRPVVIFGVRRASRSRRRRAEGLCARCGYDLRATPRRCPECGLETVESPPH